MNEELIIFFIPFGVGVFIGIFIGMGLQVRTEQRWIKDVKPRSLSKGLPTNKHE